MVSYLLSIKKIFASHVCRAKTLLSMDMELMAILGVAFTSAGN